MLGRWPVRSYEEQERRRGGRYIEAALGQVQKSVNGGEEDDQKGEERIEKVNSRKIREQGGTSCTLFRTDLRAKRKKRRLNRMKDEKGRIVEGEDEVLEVLARHWEELGMCVSGRGRRKHQTWPSWMLAGHMRVCGGRDYSVR